MCPGVAGGILCTELYILLACCRVGKLGNALGAFFGAIWIKIQYAALPDFAEDWYVAGGKWYACLLGFDEWQAKALEPAGAYGAAGVL